ncbi:peroxiredoxin [Lapillicoccus jejuensis]|uniref:Alkyl hydroperoxide reductase E n=1 Tax=Lapillicoccus jejuensis TaxID=402171 RepID=A0A542E606_9MICO|nr:peroxiredoxin [Lapillicoccus jejuensis]
MTGTAFLPEGVEPLAVGERAPDFTLVDQHGTPTRLADLLADRAVVVVFYPFAFSGICTSELREIRDRLGDFEADDLTVVTVSCDSIYSLRVWADLEGYFFPLLSDFWPHGAVARSYGVFAPTTGFAVRGTFLVGRDGVVRWTQVNEAGRQRDFGGLREAVTVMRAEAAGDSAPASTGGSATLSAGLPARAAGL